MELFNLKMRRLLLNMEKLHAFDSSPDGLHCIPEQSDLAAIAFGRGLGWAISRCAFQPQPLIL